MTYYFILAVYFKDSTCTAILVLRGAFNYYVNYVDKRIDGM